MNAFFAYIIILFVLAATLKVDFFFTILYLFVGVFIVLRFWLNHVFSRLETRRTFVPRAFPGDTIQVKLDIANNSPLPIPWLSLNEAVPWSLSSGANQMLQQVISLHGKEKRTITYTLKATRRGYYQVGPLNLTSGDLLGITRSQTTQLEAGTLIVYPKVVSMADLKLPTHSPQAILPIPLPIFEDPARITGLRSYQWGDNPRHIHWPATAAGNQVMVKQFQPAIARESIIFLNLSRKDYHRKQREHALELAITVAASLATHMLINEKLTVGLDTTAMDPPAQQERHFNLPPGKGQSHLMQILEVLARVQPVDQSDFPANLRHEAINLGWGATIMVISNKTTETLINTLLWLKQIGFSPGLALVGHKTEPTVNSRLPIPVFDIWHEKDIETWFPNL